MFAINNSYRRFSNWIISMCLCLVAMTSGSVAQAEENGGPNVASPNAESLLEMSLEELVNVEVTLASKRTERLFDTASAIYVISGEDIQRSGVNTIAEALRMVPGLTVASIDGNKWAISSRGFVDRFANKMLVLMDGRSIYTPCFSGVYWDVQDTLLDDIDRIEVIRGPGATLWGANAVNGIINIITKKSHNTKGAFLATSFGTEERSIVDVRYGDAIGKNGSYRVYVKQRNHDNTAAQFSNKPAEDKWSQKRAGFRVDWGGDNYGWTLQGDIYEGTALQRLLSSTISPNWPIALEFTDTIKVSGGNLIARWEKTFSDNSEVTLQAYYDRSQRSDWTAAETRDTVDIDFQQHYDPDNNHNIVWGFGYRYTTDKLTSSPAFMFDPGRRSDNLYNAFIQDEITLKKNRSSITIGSKLEHNDYTGFEIQPSIRMLYTPSSQQTWWASISRAVRTPSRSESDGRFVMERWVAGEIWQYGGDIFGNKHLKSEELTAFELGYRANPNRKFFFDAAAFYNIYANIRTFRVGTPYMQPNPPRFVVPINMTNEARGQTYGLELAANWQVTDTWRLATTYSYLRTNIELDPTAPIVMTERVIEDGAPRHQFGVRSYLNIGSNLKFDLMLYYVDKIKDRFVDELLRLDVRLGWRPTEGLEIIVGGRNLLEGKHREFGTTLLEVANEVERSWYCKIARHF